MQQVMGFSVQLKGESLGFAHTIQLPVCWLWLVRGSTAHRHSKRLGWLPRGCGGWLVRDAESQLPGMLLLSLPWASPPTAAQATTKISPLPQGNAGVVLGIALPVALHSPAQLWGRAGRDASACDELLGCVGRLEVPAAIGDSTCIPSSTPLKALHLPFMTFCCAPAL